MKTRATGSPLGQLVYDLGSAVLFVVAALPTIFFLFVFVWADGIDNWLHDEWAGVQHRTGIELVVFPLAALAAGVLRWGVEVIDARGASRGLWLPLLGTAAVCILMWLVWLEVAASLVILALLAIAAGVLWQAAREEARVSAAEATDWPRESSTPWVPWVGAALAFAVIAFVVWSWAPPQTLVGPREFGVARWVGTALLAATAYLGMIFFPRLTAAMAGAVAGPALFAVVGYILFPSLMQDPEGRLVGTLVTASVVVATLVVTAALFAITFSERLRRHPLSYAVWTGALTFCLAVSGTFNGTSWST